MAGEKPLSTALTIISAALLAAGQSPPVAVTGARIHTLEGDPIDAGILLMKDGKIAAVGAAVEIPADARRIDGTGLVIVPGLIDAGSFLLLERTERGGAGEAHHRVADGLDHFARGASATIRGGVTTALVLPDASGPVRGLAAAVRVPPAPGARVEVLNAEAGLLLSMAPGDGNTISTLETYRQYRLLKGRLEGARKAIETWEKYGKDLEEFPKKKKEYEEAKKKAEGQQAKPEEPKEPPRPARDPAQEALSRLFVEGSKAGGTGPVLPLLIEAHTRDEIQFALKLAEEFKLRFTLVGATEGSACADALAKAKVPVVVGPSPFVTGGERPRWSNRSIETPARLAAGGLRVSFASLPLESAGYPRFPAGDPGRFLLLAAGQAVAGGMDRRRALQALTLDAAETIGLKSRIGSLAAGKDADVVLLTGEPFELETRVARVFSCGREAAP